MGLREADWIDRVLFAKGDAPRCGKMMCRFSLCGERFVTGTIPTGQIFGTIGTRTLRVRGIT